MSERVKSCGVRRKKRIRVASSPNVLCALEKKGTKGSAVRLHEEEGALQSECSLELQCVDLLTANLQAQKRGQFTNEGGKVGCVEVEEERRRVEVFGRGRRNLIWAPESSTPLLHLDSRVLVGGKQKTKPLPFPRQPTLYGHLSPVPRGRLPMLPPSDDVVCRP